MILLATNFRASFPGGFFIKLFFGAQWVQTYLCRPKKSRVRLRARTPPFHGGDTGSNPVRGTKALQKCKAFFYKLKEKVLTGVY